MVIAGKSQHLLLTKSLTCGRWSVLGLQKQKKKFNTEYQVIYFFINSFNIFYSNMTSFFRFVNKREIYRLGRISLAHSPVHVTDFPVVNVYADELSSARILQHKLCATLSANVIINYRLPIKVYYRICTLGHIRIEINHGSQNVC